MRLLEFFQPMNELCGTVLGSKFGAMLDQLTDRAATMCLLVQLSVFLFETIFLEGQEDGISTRQDS